ncbi:MAG: hypothetical protein M3P29_13110 [Acidobacteriota bacterium]|nr:hypothetical protein [Acidobacteriota bacterium]
MTDERRILRTVGIPIVVAFILLFVMPKMCARAVPVSEARQEKAARATGGLHIESSQKPVSYPAGLDPERVRYLVEVDSRFAAPYNVRVLKASPAGTTDVDQRVVPALQKLGYAEVGSDGTLTLTRDGMLHLEGLVDDGASWTFPLAKRQFRSVTSIDTEGGNARAGFAWQWQSNNAGTTLMPSPKRHEANAELTNGGGRWTLVQINDLDSDLE